MADWNRSPEEAYTAKPNILLPIERFPDAARQTALEERAAKHQETDTSPTGQNITTQSASGAVVTETRKARGRG